jgi:hypothetical protein
MPYMASKRSDATLAKGAVALCPICRNTDARID